MKSSFYQKLLGQVQVEYAYHTSVLNTEGKIADFIIKEVSQNFEKIIGKDSKDFINKTVSKVFADSKTALGWETSYINMLLEEDNSSFEFYSNSMDKWFKAQLIVIDQDASAIAFTDISDLKTNKLFILNSNNRVTKQRAAVADLLLHDATVSSDIAAATPFMTKLLAQTIDAARASIWLLSDNKQEMYCISLYETDGEKHSSGTVLYSKDFPNYFKALCVDARIYASDAQKDPRTSEFSEIYLKPLNITAMLDAGIIINGDVKGVVCLEHIGGNSRAWQVDEEAFVSTAAAVISQILLNSEHKKAAIALEESKQHLEDISELRQREQLLREKQEVLLMELSTPVTQLWDGILLLPLVGIIDSKRAHDIMNAMLNKIADTQSKIFILDISGVSIMDTSVANYIIKITKATKLMGCTCFISGVSGAVAQTIVELGIQIEDIETTGNMQDALRNAFNLTGTQIIRKS